MAGEIVVGYDGTECADKALDVAIGLATELGSEMVIVYGYDPSPMGGEVRDQDLALAARGREVTATALEKAQAAGVGSRVDVVKMKASVALTQTAANLDARMIVVGGYGERPITGVILGSTPHKLLQMSHVPVLVVRAD